MAGKSGYIIAAGLGVLVLAAVFLPQIRQFWLSLRAEEVEVPEASGTTASAPHETRNLNLVNDLGRKGIWEYGI